MWLLLLDLQHEHQAGVLVAEEVQQEHQEVVDDIGLIALPARVHVDGQTGIPQSQPLEEDSRDRITFYIYMINTLIKELVMPRLSRSQMKDKKKEGWKKHGVALY